MADLAGLTEPDLEDVVTLTPQVDKSVPEAVLTPKTIAGMNILKAKNIESGFNFLVYGNPGVGKTLLAGSAAGVPDMCPVLMIDIEGGAMPLQSNYPDVDVLRVKSFSDLQHVYDELRRGKTGYRTVIIDSISEGQKFSMYGVMKEMLAKNQDKDRDPDVPGMHEWMKNTEQIRLFVRAFRDLPLNTIFTALAVHEKDQRTGLYITKPGLSAKLAYEVSGFVDIVCYQYIKVKRDETLRLLLTMATDTVTAKDRSGKLPPILEYPTMADVYAYMHGTKTYTQPEKKAETKS